jgi:hypothetical protein
MKFDAERRHRNQGAHDCTAAKDYTIKQDAAAVRKAKAQEVLRKTMPGKAGKEIPKPPPPRDTTTKLPPTNVTVTADEKDARPATEIVKKSKTKAEKLHEVQLMKLRSMAQSLPSGKHVDVSRRRYFEWCIAKSGDVESWVSSGKWSGIKPDRVYADTVSILVMS